MLIPRDLEAQCVSWEGSLDNQQGADAAGQKRQPRQVGPPDWTEPERRRGLHRQAEWLRLARPTWAENSRSLNALIHPQRISLGRHMWTQCPAGSHRPAWLNNVAPRQYRTAWIFSTLEIKRLQSRRRCFNQRSFDIFAQILILRLWHPNGLTKRKISASPLAEKQLASRRSIIMKYWKRQSSG